MPISSISISDGQSQLILEMEESHFLDLKSIDIAPSKLSRTISALSNASGGELYVGIDEVIEHDQKKRYWRGFSDTEAANAHLQVFDRLFPLGQYYSYLFLSSSVGPGLVLQVSVNKTREITKGSDSVAYIRRGAQNLPVTTPEAITRLRLDKGISSFEAETVDVSSETVTNSVPILQFLLTSFQPPSRMLGFKSNNCCAVGSPPSRRYFCSQKNPRRRFQSAAVSRSTVTRQARRREGERLSLLTPLPSKVTYINRSRMLLRKQPSS
jgi:hypothetical protein